mmetsp:Transcript_52098/g.86211  ORF Transcript_52098/g.86211 Transcript_52098/m.86211 type:complete len:335 (+) Transcript_52098:78-1082(+)
MTVLVMGNIMMMSDAFYPSVVSLFVVFLIWSLSALRVAYKFHCLNVSEHEPVHRYLRWSAMCYFVSWCIAYFVIMLLCSLIFTYHSFFFNPGTGWSLLCVIASVAGSTGFCCINFFLTARLYFAFEGTYPAIRVTTTTVKRHMVVSFIVTVLFCFLSLSYFVLKEQAEFDIVSYRVTAPIGGLAYILNMVNAVSILYQFTDKLVLFSAESSRNNAHEALAGNLAVAAKHCLLGIIGILCFNVLIPLTFVVYVLMPHNIVTLMTTVFICAMLHTVEMLTLFLGFAFNGKYYRTACYPCDSLCHWLLRKETKRRRHKMQALMSRSRSTSNGMDAAV